MSFNSSTVLNSVAVPAGTANDPAAVEIGDTINQILVYVTNNGDSTNLEVSVGSSPDGTINALIEKLVLSTTARTKVISLSVVPAFLIFTADNKDAVNATNYSVVISKRA